MTLATVAFHNRVAVVFDFDGTLAADSFDALLVHCGVEARRWRAERLRPLLEAGWETELAHVWSLLALRSAGGRPVTAGALAEVGRSVELHDGVPGMFDRRELIAAHPLR